MDGGCQAALAGQVAPLPLSDFRLVVIATCPLAATVVGAGAGGKEARLVLLTLLRKVRSNISHVRRRRRVFPRAARDYGQVVLRPAPAAVATSAYGSCALELAALRFGNAA